MADKEFKSIDEQLEILRSRGLSITDNDKARTFLLRNNYYRISGYSLTLRNNDGTVDNAHLYGFLFVMKRLLNSEIFAAMKNEIEEVNKKYPFVRMSYYGFRSDWKSKL